MHFETPSAPERTVQGENGTGPVALTAGAREQNRLLRALPAESYEPLLLRLELVHHRVGDLIWEANQPIPWAVFPRTCVMSLLVPLSDAKPVEAATVGREGFVGVPLVLGSLTTTMRCISQVEGEALRLPAAELIELLEEDRALMRLLLRYTQLLHEQTAQSVACNGRHDMEQRCARWLLMTHDRVGSDRFYLTHDFLAQMLGVRRASVTVAAGRLQHAGLIRYARGHVTILDRGRLEAASCDCYRIIHTKDELLAG